MKRELSAALAELAARPSETRLCLEVLELAGERLVAGDRKVLLLRGDLGAAEAKALDHAVRTLDLDALEDAALEVVLGLEEHDDARVLAGLAARERAERLRAGASALLAEVPLSESARAQVVAFDGLVRPLAWKLVRLNAERSARLMSVTRERRAHHWWWSELVALPPDAARALAPVGELVARSPAAREALEDVVRTVNAQKRAAERAENTPSRPPQVVSLGAWIEARRVAGRVVNEVPLAERDGVNVVWRAPQVLVVEIAEHRIAASAPVVRLPGGAVLGATPRDRGRWEVSLDAPVLAGGVVVHVTLADGAVEIELPPE